MGRGQERVLDVGCALQAVDVRIGAGVARQRLRGEALDADAAQRRGGAGEMAVDELALEPDRLEDLGRVVGADRRDPHLREHLQEAGAERVDRPLVHHLRPEPVELVLVGHLLDGVEHHVRVDRARAVADQRGDMVDLARLAALDREAGAHAVAAPDEVLVDGGRRQERGDRHALLRQGTVGEHDDVRAARDRRRGVLAKPLERGLHPGRAVGDRPGHVQHLGPQAAPVERPQHGRLLVREHGLLQDQLRRGEGTLLQQVLLRPEAGAKAHHDVLADGVDRRVRDLGEALLEVGEEAGRVLREHRQRDVVAHRARRLLRVPRHRRQDDPQVLLRIAERELGLAELLVRRVTLRRDALPGDVVDVDRALLVPLAPRRQRGHLALSLAPVEHAAAGEVDAEHAAGTQAPAVGDVLVGHLERAGFGRDRHPAVVRDQPAAGAQAVAVERGAEQRAVGEHDRRRAVPRLDQPRVVVVEALQVLGDAGRPVLVGAGDHHHGRVGERAAGEREQLEHVVEGERVGGPGRDEREASPEVLAEQVGLQDRLPGLHPVDVPLEGVDLAVVSAHPVRMRERPAREGVGREPGVDDRQRAGQSGVAQIGVEPGELRRAQHPLVDHGARGEAGERDLARAQLRDPPDHEQLALEGVLVGAPGAAPDHQLADDRHRGARRAAAALRVGRNVAPAERQLALRPDRLLQLGLEGLAALGVNRQEAHRYRQLAGRRHVGWLQAEVAGASAQELAGELDQDPGAVAGVRVGALGSAVLEVVQGREAPLDHLVDRFAV